MRQPCLRVVMLSVVMLGLALTVLAQSTSVPGAAVTWLNGKQDPGGSWGTVPELAPRDTARALLALRAAKATAPGAERGYAWLASQPSDANQLLSETVLALKATAIGSSTQLAKLAQQHSPIGADYGGFADYLGNSYDSALALEAFIGSELQYPSAVSSLVSSLTARQNPDGGWGLDRGFASNPIVTAEVLVALSMLPRQTAPPSLIASAQTWLASRVHADGSIGNGALETAIAARALAFSGYAVTSFFPTTLNYLRGNELPDGSWGDDVYVTARVIEAFASDKVNLTIRSGDFTLSPLTVADGGTVTAHVTVTNIGTVVSQFFHCAVYAADARATPVAVSVLLPNVNPGTSFSTSMTFAATGLIGTKTFVAVADSANELDELREDDNEATATLTITGKPDLQIFASDITSSPARPQPNAAVQLFVTIHNNGQTDVPSPGYAIYDKAGTAPEVLLQRGTTGTIAAGGATTIQLPVTFATGSHVVRAVADPDNLVSETSKTNNQASRNIAVTNVSNIDFRTRPFTVTPSRPSVGTSIAIGTIVENLGTSPGATTIVVYDGVPGAGGIPIATQASFIDAGSFVLVRMNYTVTASSKVIYVVADPDNTTPEIDETNNAAFAVLTDQYADLQVTRDGVVLAKPLPAAGQIANARVVVKNLGALPATQVEVAVYDDLPQLGGVRAVDTFVDVPAQGSVVVPASWTVRAGQRFATVDVNATHSLFEPDFSNNRATRPYTANGRGVDISYLLVPDLSQLKVDPLTLNVSGTVSLTVDGRTNTPYLVTIFEDVDGDRAFDPTIDNVLGSTLVQPVTVFNTAVLVPVQGTVRFAPGHLMSYLDSGNAVAESDETNNILDLYHNCSTDLSPNTTPRAVKWTTTSPSHVLSPVGRIVDTNGDGVLDANDVPVVVIATNGGIILKRGDNGQTLWAKALDTTGRQISPVIADLDGDGKAEIIAHTDTDPITGDTGQHRLIALNAADGTTKWVSPQLERDPAFPSTKTYSYGGAPAVASLDGVTVSVIVGRTVLNGSDGTIRWIGTGGAGRAPSGRTDLYNTGFPDQEAPIAVDVDNDGKLDVVAGNTVYRGDGTILWQRSDLPDGYTGATWFGSDTQPHICLVAQGNIWMLNSDGTTLWGPVAVPHGATLGGAPTIFDKSGRPVVAVAGDGFLSALDAATGTVLWSQQVATDLTATDLTATNSATAFNVIGQTDLFYVSRDTFVIIAANGFLEYSDPAIGANCFYPGGPAIADIDDDGHAEAIVPGRDRVRVLGDGTWHEAPAIFNEASFHGVNVDENGRIPSHEVEDTFSRINFRAARSSSSSTNTILEPNLTASYPRVDGSEYPTDTKLIVRIGNNGWATSPATTVAFNRVNADGSKTLLGNAPVDTLAAGAYADVVFTVPNPPAVFSFSATVNPANTVIECDGGDNTTASFSARLSADIAASLTSFVASDLEPRQGDAVDLSAGATVRGVINTASLAAQFFLGNPAAGGTAISPLLPVTLQTSSGVTTATVAYHWTVNSQAGTQVIYALFDPQNVIAEDDETNNAVTQAITITTPDPIRNLSATVTLTPPAAEPGTPVRVDVLVQNIGNVPLSNVPLTYSVTGGPAGGSTGTATLSSLAKNNAALLTLGTFTPSSVATYSVALTSSDPSTTLIVSPKTITIGPFAAGMLTAVPSRLPTVSPLLQAHAHISRANTIAVAEDPLLPLIRARIQKAIDFEAFTVTSPDQITCFKCHVQAQAIVSFETASGLPGVNVSASAEQAAIDPILKSIDGTGTLPAADPYPMDGKTRLAAWALSYLHDTTVVSTYLPPMTEQVLRAQQPDGSWTCNGGCSNQVSATGDEAETMLAVDELARAYAQNGDPRLLSALTRGSRWFLGYDYLSTGSTSCELAARVSIGLSKALPYLDADTAALAKARVASITQYLRSFQNADGTFGAQAGLPRQINRSAQTLYAIILGGARSDDPVVQAATLWFLNNQGTNGAWPVNVSGPTAIDQTTWSVIALAAAWSRNNPLDVDFHLTIPNSTELVSTVPGAGVANPTATGHDLVWHLTNVTDTGYDLFANLKLNGIQNGEVRPVASAASISYVDPYSGQPVSRPIDVPTVTGTAPTAVTLATDHPSYASSQPVTITETIANATDGATNDLTVSDQTGTTVATLAAAEPITGLPSPAFPGWHYGLPVTLQIPKTGASRNAAIALDFAQLLASAGGSGTLDPHSIRVSADGAPASELLFTWFPSDTAPARGNLIVQIPDSSAVGALPILVWFDTVENGLKPSSLFDRNVTGVGSGLFATYWAVDSNLTNGLFALDPSQVFVIQPPVATMANLTSHISAPSIVNSLRFFETVWTGAIYAPSTGTYQFTLGSAQGAWLDIDGVRIINNGGIHSVVEVTKAVSLTAGLHSVKITMFRWDFTAFDLYLRWAPPGSGFSDIAPQDLFFDIPFAASSSSTGNPFALSMGQATRTYTWNTASTAPGTYSVNAAVRQGGALAGGASAAFTITPSAQITATVATDLAAYDTGGTVHVSAAAQYTTGNASLATLTATTSIVSPSAAIMASHVTPIASLQPGQSASAPLDWLVGSAAPGTYTAVLVVKDSAGSVLAQKSVPFTVRSTAQNGGGVTGTVTAPASVAQGQSVAFAVSLTNGGNADVSNGAFAIRIIDPATQNAAGEAPFNTSIVAGATTGKSVTFDTTPLGQQTYDAWLVSLVSGTAVPLAKTSFTVSASVALVTVSMALDKTSYDPGDTLHETTTVQYTSGATTLANVAVTASINGTSSTATVASLVPHTTATTTFDWPVGTTAPGTYPLTVVVKDANGATLAQQSTTVTIRSTAQTGAGITGSLSAGSSVTQGNPLSLTATINDGGNAALVNAPFAVTISSDTLPFTLSVPLAGSATKQLTYATGSLAPGTYTATLVSSITGTPVVLATGTFTVNPLATNVTAAVALDKASYDSGQTLHETTTIHYVSGPSTLVNATVTTTVTDSTSAAVTSATSTIASLAPGTSTTTTFNWPVGTTAPGTYTLATLVKDANGTALAQNATTFTIRSTAQSGAGVSGTLTTSASVTKGDSLPLTATITDGGNAPLANAPFAVTIGSDTLPFTSSVAMGSSATKQLTYATSALAPGNYTATLISNISGAPVVLATATFIVTQAPTVVNATAVTDKSSYDAGDTLHETTSVRYVSGPATLTNLSVTATVTNASSAVLTTNTSTIASLAPGATTTTTFTWPVAVNAPGTYTLSVVVKDSGGAALAQKTVTFTITSTAVSGKGVAGTLTTSASVTKGDVLPLTATITDSGNAALTDAPFAVKIASDSLPFTASVAIGGSATRPLTYSTSALAPATYTATLVSTITGSPVTLATASFIVKPAATQPTLTVSLSSTPRVLLRAECNSDSGDDSGDDRNECGSNAPPFVARTLTDAAIPWTLLSDDDTFLKLLRVGSYTETILAPPNDGKISDEISEMIHAGVGLIVIDNQPADLPKLTPALGASFHGRLTATSTLLSVPATPIAGSGQLTVNGNGVRIDLATAKAAANIAATGLPAISYNVFGSGRAVLIPFNVEKTTTPAMASFLLGSVSYVTRSASTDARSVAAVEFAIAAPVGGSQSVKLNVTLPPSLTLLASTPAPSTGTTWNLTIPGGTTARVTLRIRLADATGSYNVSGTIVVAGQAISTKTVSLNVTADRAAIESALASDLTALAASAPSKDQHAITDAQHELASIRAVAGDEHDEDDGADGTTRHLLKIVSDLDSLSLYPSAARRDTDRLFLWWESRLANQED